MEPNKPEASEHPRSNARPDRRKARNVPAAGLRAVSETVRSFLIGELGAREVRVTRIVASGGADGGWDAEAEILVPDLAMKTLGLPLTQEVLEQRGYAVRVDRSLAVSGYEPLDREG